MAALTSRSNPRVKAAAALHRRRTRLETGTHLVEGPHAVGEALAAGVVATVFGLPAALAELDVPADVEVVEVTDPVLERLADTTTPQGLVAVARTPALGPADLPGDGLLVVLDGLSDPGNVGTVLRTADAAGARAVWCTPGTADPYAPKAVRAAAGSTYHLPLVVDADLDALLSHARGHGRRLVGLDVAGDVPVTDLAAGPLALVLGNEAHGMSEATRERLDATVAIPMPGAAESLNVAAAAAVAIYAAAGLLRRG